MVNPELVCVAGTLTAQEYFHAESRTLEGDVLSENYPAFEQKQTFITSNVLFRLVHSLESIGEVIQ